MKCSGLKPIHLNRHHSPQHGDHLVHFFDKTDALEQSFCQYAIPGISRGEGVVIVATQKHQEAFHQALQKRSIDVARVISRGQLLMIDAHEFLARFLVDQRPDPKIFELETRNVFKSMKKKYSTIRAYGEMVNILCEDGNHMAAVELERLWHELIKTEPVSVLCGYHAGYFHDSHKLHFTEICSSHTHIVVSDGVMKVR